MSLIYMNVNMQQPRKISSNTYQLCLLVNPERILDGRLIDGGDVSFVAVETIIFVSTNNDYNVVTHPYDATKAPPGFCSMAYFI